MILSENKSSETVEAYFSFAKQCSLVFEKLINDEKIAQNLIENFADPFTENDMKNMLDSAEIVDEITLKKALRICRKSVLARLILRDLNGLADLDEVMLTTSLLAEVTLKTANRYLTSWLSIRHGLPEFSAENPEERQNLIIIGMGKLGGYELNVSSDIDLIFAYESAGNTDGEAPISHQEYFTKIAKKLIYIIDDFSEDGFVFRVDMRLRPFGSEGALVCSLSGLEDYYQQYGREWERYAWIKGRVINGSETVEQLLKPFIYRKYLDFGALENMRDLKKQIHDEVYRKELHDNIKLGRGGIREIEFIAQAFQLMRGGQERTLQIKPTLKALNNLVDIGLLDAEDVAELHAAYTFLRNLEHRLQYYQDQQTHDLPSNESERVVIAKAMGFATWEALISTLSNHRQLVAEQFDDVFAYEEEPEVVESEALLLWKGALSADGTIAQLTALGFTDPVSAASQLHAFKHSPRYKLLPEVSLNRLNSFMPEVILKSGQQHNANDTLQRMIGLIETICRRASYLAFFVEYPIALNRLVAMVSASPWIAKYLGEHPLLLDGLIVEEPLDIEAGYDDAQLEAQILDKLQWLDGDTEQQMNVLREFQQQQLFALASKDVIQGVPIQTLSDMLSNLADIILRVVMKVVWPTIKGCHRDVPQFAIVAYGKHGGRELSYLSDLDLVFIFDDQHPEAREIYSRFGMRIISWLNTMTSSGILYETDMQLRPDGNSGLLVISAEGFERYQLEKAWIWEHQAITRARFAVGDKQVGAAFEKAREKVLLLPHDDADLKQQVLDMRDRMKNVYRYVEGEFDLKKSLGGMIDIEFIVQYLILKHAHTYPVLLKNAGNVSILNSCSKAGLIPEDLAKATGEAYLTLRKAQHAIRLQGVADAKVSEAQMSPVIETVRTLWQFVFYQDI